MLRSNSSTTAVAPPNAANGVAGDSRGTARDLRVVWLLVVATFVVFLNETTMAVALKPIMTDLHVTERTGQWLSTAFMLTMAVVIPVTGFLLQRFRTRTMYAAAMSFFVAGTLLAAVAPGFPPLLFARVVQACGTAIMLPLLMTTLMTVVPESRRGRMMGNVSVVISVAPALGPTLSGLLLDTVGWRGIFWLMLPLGVGMLAYGVRTVTDVGVLRAVRIDVPSVVLAAVGFGGLVSGLSQVGSDGGSGGGATGGGNAMWVGLGVGVLTVSAFVARQLHLQRTDRALLDLRTFRSRQFTVAVVIMAMIMASLFGLVIVLPMYLQAVLHLEPLRVGLLLLPGGLALGLLGPPVGRLYDRYGARALVVPGAMVTSAVMWSLTFVGQHTSPYAVLAAHIVINIALGFVFTPLFTSGLGAVAPHLYSHASATLGTIQQVAGAAGTALFITILAGRSSSLAASGVGADAAYAGGVRTAFLVGAVLSLVPVVAAWFVRSPAATDRRQAHPH